MLLCVTMQSRMEVNELDNLTTGKAVDALLNYETVKLFNNEKLEVRPSEGLHIPSCQFLPTALFAWTAQHTVSPFCCSHGVESYQESCNNLQGLQLN